MSGYYHTAMAQYRKFETIFPEKELLGLSPDFNNHVSVSDLFIFPRSILPWKIFPPFLGI
jgi:hypothetical protein